MFHIGGEQEVASKPYHREITNSGRSSLRLIIESAELQGKRLLLPNFLCEVIADVLLDYNINIDFYEVDESFEFQLPNNLMKYDALYLIKYFGMTTESFLSATSSFQNCLIIDDVFSPYPHQLDRASMWFSYNSLRKISHVADFSLLYSNVSLRKLDMPKLPFFSSLKYEAKNLKSKFLNKKEGEESHYLSLFMEAEKILDGSRGINRASTESIYEAIEFYARLERETKVRKENYQALATRFGQNMLGSDLPFYSFFPVLLPNRDEIRKKLMGKNIFLAVHWPAISQVDNKLSNYILSIPLDCRYNKEMQHYLCDAILLEVK